MEEQKLKIAIFTDNFFPAVGGTENAVYNLATALTNLGHSVLVVAPNYKNVDDSKYIFKIYRKKSIRIDANNNYALPFCNKKLWRTLDEFAPEILHCHSQASMLTLAMKYSKKHNIPLISTIHTKFSYCYKESAKLNIIVKPMLKAIGKKLKKIGLVTTVSYSMKDEFKLYGYNGDFKVIRNGLSIKVFDQNEIQNLAKEKYDIKDSDNVFIFVGRISKMKNIEFILNCLEILNNKNIDFKMFIVGEGGELKNYQNLAKQKNLLSKVVFTGKVTDKKLLSSLYLNSCLNVFPSVADNDSLTIVEAAMYKTPSITIKDTGSSERITNNVNGFIVENNVQDMATKIEELLKNKEVLLQAGENAKAQMVKSWDDVAQDYLNLYYDYLNKKKTN